jgi:hypothetical protein
VTRTKALVDFNVEFAAVGKQDCEVGTLWYRSIYLKADFFYLIMKDFAEMIQEKRCSLWNYV